MRITEDIIKDSFYKMYFYLPDIGDTKKSYKECLKDFWLKQGIEGLEASLSYICADTKEFLANYVDGVSDYSVAIRGLKPDCELDTTDDQLNEAIFEYIRKKHSEINNGFTYDRINEYWKSHSQELLFLIRKRNSFENAAMKKEVQKNLSEFNDNALRFINELIQNADDCIYKDEFNSFTMLFNRDTSEIKIFYPEEGFTYADVISLSSINETNKMSNFIKATSTIGEKGRGFKSIFVYFKEVEILSGGFHFKYNVDEASMFQPLYLSGGEEQQGTSLTLKLKDKIVISNEDVEESIQIDADIDKLIQDVECFYGARNAENLYRNNSVFFTRHFNELRIVFQGSEYSDLLCIKNNHYISDVMTKESVWWYKPDKNNTHICKGDMSYLSAYQVRNDDVEKYFELQKLEKQYQIDLLGMISYVKFPTEIVEGRYGRIKERNWLVELSRKMPIIMFGIKSVVKKDGTYDDLSKYAGHMYTYLPTSVNLHIPFIFQVPFDLENNRSCPKKSAWNNYLYDEIWGSNSSVLKKWYEYFANSQQIESIYDYLPGQQGNTFEKIAFYIDEKYNFDSLGGSRYAAVAKESISRFNYSNRNRIERIFTRLRIFKCFNTELCTSIENLRIIDEAIGMFDIDGINLLWNAYNNMNTYERFEYDLSDDSSKKICNFCSFLRKKDIEVYAKEVLRNTKMLSYVNGELNRIRKEGNTDYHLEFSKIYLKQRLWELVYDVKSVDELTDGNISNIRGWGTKLLCFKVKAFNNKSYICPYKTPEMSNPTLWLYNDSSKNLRSYIADKELNVCIMNKSANDDLTIKELLFRAEQRVSNIREVVSCVASWKNEDVTSEQRISVMGTYYLSQTTFPDQVWDVLKKEILEQKNICDIEIPLFVEPSLEKQQEWERVKFFSWDEGKRKEKYRLTLEYLSKDIIDIINPIEENIITCHDRRIGFKNNVRGLLLTDKEKVNCTDTFLKKFTNIFISPDYFYSLPGRDFLKFPFSQTLILKELGYLSEAMESETKLSIDFVREVRKIYENIQANNYVPPAGMNYEQAIIKGIQAYQIFSLVNADNYREVIGNEGYVLNELLQNINDYIEIGTNVVFQVNTESKEKSFRIIYKEKPHTEERNGRNEERCGFQAKDILSLISIGVSAKTRDSDKYVGNKGIGFKNVYKLFDLVEVDSNRFQFALDDSYLIDANQLFKDISEKGIKSIQLDKKFKVEEILDNHSADKDNYYSLENSKERTKFPIIQYSKNPINKQGYYVLNNDQIGKKDVNTDSLTAFQFRFRNNKNAYADFLAQLSSNYYVYRIYQSSMEDIRNGQSFEKAYRMGYNYRILFLHNCNSIRVGTDTDATKKYDIPAIMDESGDCLHDTWVEDEYFWSNRSYLDGLNLLQDKSPRYVNKKNSEEDGIFKNVEVRFMKMPVILNDQNQKALKCNGLLYSTLPLNMDVGGAVHVNIPALETQVNREQIIFGDMDRNTTIGNWNRAILEKVFGPNGVFVDLFNSFIEKYKNKIANYAFMYVPIDLYDLLQRRFPGFRSGIRYLRCIPCMTSTGIQMRSVNEISQNHLVFKLKPYMLQWFDLMDSGFQKFYVRRYSKIEFIYMKDENDWNLKNEFSKYKYNSIQPKKEYFDEDYFFEYITDYWELYYDSLSGEYQKKCDSNFSNRINMISAKTGIDQHYTKWNIWKEYYRKQEYHVSYYIRNMIKAISFGANDFDLGFLFTAEDIRQCIGIQKLEIPTTIVLSYKKCLKNKGYYDFKPFYDLAKKELQIEYNDDGKQYLIEVKNQFALERYATNVINEVDIIKHISENEIHDCIYDMGVKKLGDVREELPILLMNGRFSDGENKYYVRLPECLFESEKIQLRKNKEYIALLEDWDKKNFVVSRANISQADNIYDLICLDIEFEDLLPSLKESTMFYDLIKNNMSLIQNPNSPLLESILEFWYKKFTDFEKKYNSDYFFLYVSIINTYIEKSHGQIFDRTECEAGVEFDLRYLLHEGNVDLCNAINADEDILDIELYSSSYQNNPIQYWNEIEMNLTDEQRKKIALRYEEPADESANRIDNAIKRFLSHIYLCDENSALYSGYPSGKYLKVKVYNIYTPVNGYLLFEDYTDALIKLLKDEFDITVRKSKYLPLGNLDAYNDLFPVGTKEDYDVIKDEVKNTLDELKAQINEVNKIFVKREIDDYKLSLLALQYQMAGNYAVKGYGKECPLLTTNDVVELRSLHCFEYPIFGFHIAITLFGSKAARDVITKYSTRMQVCVQNLSVSKKKSKRANRQDIFTVEAGKYSFGGQSVVINSLEKQNNQELIYNILSTLVSMLNNIDNQLILNIEMLSDKGTKKTERFVLKLTHAHRALMVYEIEGYLKQLES